VRGIIVAVSPEGVIGVGGKVPWHYPADLKRFKRLTLGTTVIMGRLTWESIGSRPLKGRRNVVITTKALPGVECYASVAAALESCEGDVWFVGGARVYAEAMAYAELIDVTYVPDSIAAAGAVHFPDIDAAAWQAGPLLIHEDDPRLKRRIYRRKA
jgi:dihydrofolate reductase